MTYQLCNESLRWATVFREIERHREELGVADYSVSQTTLEQVRFGEKTSNSGPGSLSCKCGVTLCFDVQVFVNFAKDQAKEEHAL